MAHITILKSAVTSAPRVQNPQAPIPWDGLRAMISILEVHARTQRAVVPPCPLNSHQKPAATPTTSCYTQTRFSFLHKSVCRFSKCSRFAPVTSQQHMITLLLKMHLKKRPKVLIYRNFHEHEQQDYLGIRTFSDNAEAAYH